MKLKENSSAQKLRGAYYTPLPLAGDDGEVVFR